MQRAPSERSRTKERLEASLAGLCELELRRQRQERLVLGALALGEPLGQDGSGGQLESFSSWGQENLTLRRQMSAIHSAPWGLMQALEQQVGDLKIDIDDGCCEAAQGGDSQPSSGFYDSSEGRSPKGKTSLAEPTEPVSSWAYTNDRPKSLGDGYKLNGEFDVPAIRPNLPRSFSAPHPTLEGIVEEGSFGDSWRWETSIGGHAWQQQPPEDQIPEEDYQQAFRVEGYILSLIQRYALVPRPCQPRTTLTPDPPYCGASGHSSQHRRTPSLTPEQRLPDPHPEPPVDLSANLNSQEWGCDLPEGEVRRAEAPSFEESCYLPLSYPQSRPNPLTGRLPSPLPSLEPNCGLVNLDLCSEPPSPQHYLHPQPSVYQVHNLVSAQYIPGQACHAPLRSPRHYKPESSKVNRAAASPDQPNSKSKAPKKNHNDRQKSKKATNKTNRSQSENTLPGLRVVPDRRYNTSERRPGRTNPVQNQCQATAAQVVSKGPSGNRRWCSNLELSQDEGEIQNAEQAHKRSSRKARHGHSCSQSQSLSQQQHSQRWQQDSQARAPLCPSEEVYTAAAPAESESSMSEVYSPPSSSMSSDSDESGGLVWPQQLPPRLASTSSSSSASPQATASAAAQPKAFVKIKASHALKKKILRFRTGSLKVMTTV